MLFGETVAVYCEKHTGERERERMWGEVVRNTTFKGGARNIIPGLKVPRQCPLVLLVEVYLTQGEAFNFCITLEGLHNSEILN
jgi:predicted metal-dependent RNase